MVIRIDNPRKVSGNEIEEIISRGMPATIQFSQPIYSKKLLRSINELCETFGDQLEVRFYGHYSVKFDCSILSHLPEVQWLSLDCLTEIENIDKLFSLTKIRKFAFGVFRFSCPNLLSHLDLNQMTRLCLIENDKRNLNLEFLDQCSSLQTLFLNGHSKNIEALSSLEKLSYVSLGSLPKKQGLGFLNALNSLRELTVILGGRDDINEFAHEHLISLEVIRVRGLESLGNLARFPNLERLRIEDQIRLEEIRFGRSKKIRELSIHNCKNLRELTGLLHLPALQSFRVSRTNLNLDAYVEAEWPTSMEIVALNSRSNKWNETAKQRLEERGYKEFGDIPSKWS